MKKYYVYLVSLFLVGCATSAELKLNDLPPVYISTTTGNFGNAGSSGSGSGTGYQQIYPQTRPENALEYSSINKMNRNGTDLIYYFSSVNVKSNYDIVPWFYYYNNDVSFNPGCNSYDYSTIIYLGDSFVRNQYGFAEQIVSNVPALSSYDTFDGFKETKLVLGGGLSGLQYTDFGYWIGVPNNYTKSVIYDAFNLRGATEYTNISSGTVFTGKTAAIAYTVGQDGSARELGGNATLTFENSDRTDLKLEFDNYYTFDIVARRAGGSVESVTVRGVNTNGGPGFSSCVSGCSSNVSASYSYYGDNYAVKEASGNYKYTKDNNVLIGSFGAKKN